MMYVLALSAGLSGGLLGPLAGVGGGIVIVPTLNIAGVDFREAASASLFSIVITSSISTYNYRRLIKWNELAIYVALAATAAALGALIAAEVGGGWIEFAYGLYLFGMGAILLRNIKPRSRKPLLGYLLILLGGGASSLFGIGGGTIYVPALILTATYDAKSAVAASMGIILPTVLASSAIYGVFGVLDIELALFVALGSSIGSYTSSKYIMPRLNSEAVRRIFLAYVFVVGSYYLANSILGA